MTSTDNTPGTFLRPRISTVVESVELVAHDVVALRLAAEDGHQLPTWTPGSHIDLTLPSGTVRQYSLCGDPSDASAYRIAILREMDGRGGSAELHDAVKSGSRLMISEPKNHFKLRSSPRYLLIAGGIGITPILSMARELSAGDSDWALYYGGRSTESMALVPELEQICGDRLHVVPEDQLGVLDLKAIITSWPSQGSIYACGPGGMLKAIETICESAERSTELVIERFAPGVTPTAEPIAATDQRTFEVELARSGKVLSVPTDRTILQVVRDVLDDVPSSCEEGFCGTCECGVLGGTPDHRDEVLSDEERAAGRSMMICVSRSLSDRLILDL